ncbi:MAG: DUF1854 domain-containing protein [Lachnospiraceae bacterium]|nr:DUF1854 domain-containing protein [Lachnospiraceae bacterium]
MRDHFEEEFSLEQMEQETEAMLRLRYLTPETATFSRTEGGFVSLKVEGEEYSRVQVVRMFPFSEPGKYISIRTAEETSKEIGVIESMDTFPQEVGEMLLEQLGLRYFTPIITKVYQIKDQYGFAYFDVETDRGRCRFVIRMGGNAVVHLSDTRIIISDIDENRFEIPDVSKLTVKEQKKLDLFL